MPWSLRGMAAHSRIHAWRIPWTEEPGRLPPTGSHRVRHNWSDSCTHTQELKEGARRELSSFHPPDLLLSSGALVGRACLLPTRCPVSVCGPFSPTVWWKATNEEPVHLGLLCTTSSHTGVVDLDTPSLERKILCWRIMKTALLTKQPGPKWPVRFIPAVSSPDGGVGGGGVRMCS